MTLRTKIESGKFIVCAEIEPPKSSNGDVIRRKAGQLDGIVDAVNLTDNQTAIVHLSSIAAAKILLEEGLEPIMQMTCRDRNRLGIQSDLLGAAALGIHNVLCLTGDHQKFGDQPEAKGVFDLDSIQLVAMVDQLNKGRLLSGQEMKQATGFLIGAAANPFAKPFEMRLIRLHKKIQAGARFIQTQPVFDLPLFTRWMERVVDQGLHENCAILAGVMPIRTAKTIEYMRLNVSGIKINEDHIRRLNSSSDPESEGVSIAVETINTLKEIKGLRGIHLMPARWLDSVPVIVREAGLKSIN
ncbi:MAG: methylenetetrahydrofolate reductase [Fidelibacterota bacterium]|nr:MAG: methylenetetrahydrofolate reductase [Candidatus Neomarinimicrobiota bacterium]